ncbi:MAG: MBL fold metallo-hydrolase [Candidatus Eremiobacteraeota bacterium]|nr:MBL fold metallo-hydrolase [Candidatus Eremiobacteraeota bacterium]
MILLGTAGGPALRPGRSSPAAAVVVDDAVYVVDCGVGVGRQLVNAGLSPLSVKAIFLTHHHNDHNADYGNFLVSAWATGLRTPIDAYGPSLIAKLTDLALQYHAYDIAVRMQDEGRVDPRPLFRPHAVDGPGLVMKDDRVTVTAALVHHPPVHPALAYRFDTPDRSIVFSGDTTPSENLIVLAKGADLLIHEVLLLSALDRLIARVPNATTLREHIVAAHTVAADVGRVADAARVTRLALTHFVPSYDPTLTDDDWRNEVRPHFGGEVVVGRDLLEV